MLCPSNFATYHIGQDHLCLKWKYIMVLVKMKPRGVEFSLGTYMKCVGHHEIKPQVYENFIEKNKI